MVRMMIQEMEETLVEVRTSSARVLADRKEQERRLQRLQHDALDWESKACLALSKGREDLARQHWPKTSGRRNIAIGGT